MLRPLWVVIATGTDRIHKLETMQSEAQDRSICWCAELLGVPYHKDASLQERDIYIYICYPPPIDLPLLGV